MPADPAAIAAQLEQQGGGSTLATVAAAVMIIGWIGATVDAYAGWAATNEHRRA